MAPYIINFSSRERELLLVSCTILQSIKFASAGNCSETGKKMPCKNSKIFNKKTHFSTFQSQQILIISVASTRAIVKERYSYYRFVSLYLWLSGPFSPSFQWIRWLDPALVVAWCEDSTLASHRNTGAKYGKFDKIIRKTFHQGWVLRARK